MPLFSTTYLIHQHCAKNDKKCHCEGLSTKRSGANGAIEANKSLIFIGIGWFNNLATVARSKIHRNFATKLVSRIDLPILIRCVEVFPSLEVQSNNLHVFRAIKNFVRKKFFGENSDATKSETKNQCQQDNETDQHKNPDD